MTPSKAAKRTAPAPVRRPLHLTTPLTDGPDVRRLQAAMSVQFKHYKIDWLPIKVDGQFGPQTLHAARFLSWVIGLGAGHRNKIKAGVVPEATQRLLRQPVKRSKLEKRRSKRRSKRLGEIRKAQDEGPQLAVEGANACIGITEDPAGSNSGPDRIVVVRGKKYTVGVSAFERYWGLGACYWCLCFACFWVKQAGGRISGNCAYSVAIETYARNHENGFVQVAIPDARIGDLTIWKFDGPDAPSDHGELVVEVLKGVGPKLDDGGNTSAEGGSQSDGGGVFPKSVGGPERPLDQLSMVVRPLYG